MTTEISPEQLLQRFKLPAQDLAALGFCANNRPATVKSWAESLPATRITHTSVLLYQALPEICRLKTSAENRLEMLEALRSYVQQCIQGLAREFLNQPLIMPEGPLKTAVVAQALQKHMSTGYGLVLRELCRKSKQGRAPDAKLDRACHRALVGAGLLLLRSYQLYTQIPPNLWFEVHSLYRIAEHFEVLERPVRDPLLECSPASTIRDSYLRILLLACARPNQIRQQDVFTTYAVLEEWSQLAALPPATQENQDNVFLVNLSADLPPLYKSRFSGGKADDIRELDLNQLLAALRKSREQRESGASQIVNIPRTFPLALLEHLLSAWGQTHQRSFPRQSREDRVEVCVGLTNLHSQILRGVPLNVFVGEEESDDFADPEPPVDPWVTSFDAAPQPAEDDTGASVPGIPTFSVGCLNTGPGGFCLEWRDVIPTQVRAGEIVGVRGEGRYRWSLGIIRWVQQQRHTTRTGVQILAPKSTPYAAANEQPGGDYGDYLRVLMLPELKAANQAATLITPSVPFQEFNRLLLNRHGQTSRIQLSRRIFATGLVNQFTFRALGSVDAEDGEDSQEDAGDFNSVWDD